MGAVGPAAIAVDAHVFGHELADIVDEGVIEVQADDQATVVQAARAALQALTGEDHGPEPGATAADRTAALTAWRNWLAKQKQN